MKAKLRYENVYSKRSARNKPVNEDLIEQIRNEGYEPVFSVGNLSDAIRNPATAPFMVAFKPDEKVSTDLDNAELKLVKRQLQAAKMQIAKMKKGDDVKKSRFEAAAEKGIKK